jgi:hypothetical protein
MRFDRGWLNRGLVEPGDELLHLGDGMTKRFDQNWARCEDRLNVFGFGFKQEA